MVTITIQKPTDQPTRKNRLLDALRAALGSGDYSEFRLMVAFAKIGPLLRLSADIANWRRRKKTLEAIIGIDENGTSKEALEFALANFSATTITHVPGVFNPTFHPKLYLFTGSKHALAFIGSNNLTVGGTETNLETHLRIEMQLPDDVALHSDLLATWNDGQSVGVPLTALSLVQFEAAALVLPEAQTRRRSQPHVCCLLTVLQSDNAVGRQCESSIVRVALEDCLGFTKAEYHIFADRVLHVLIILHCYRNRDSFNTLEPSCICEICCELCCRNRDNYISVGCFVVSHDDKRFASDL